MIGVEKTQAVCEAAEIARGETQPAARFPGVGVGTGTGIRVGIAIETGIETSERDFVEQSEIFGKR